MTFHDWINNIRWKYFTNNKAGLIFKELMKEFRTVEQMTENKRYEIVFLNNLDGLCSIQDTEAEVPTFYNDLGYVNHIKPVCDLLNEQDKEIKRLKCINRQLEERLDRSIALDMSKCGKYVYGVHGGSND